MLKVGAEVAVAQRKPGGPAEECSFAQRVLGFVRASPASLEVGETGERVADRVEIGADSQAKMLEVISGVHDDGEVNGWQDVG